MTVHPKPAPAPDELREIGLTALVSVAPNAKAPPAARASAARSILEAVGAIGRSQDLSRLDDKRDMSTMSPKELDDEIARLTKRLKGKAVKA
jgi:hypothetical protein